MITSESKRVRRAAGARCFREFTVVEVIKASEREAQLRSPGGYVVGYERHEGPRRFMQGCSCSRP